MPSNNVQSDLLRLQDNFELLERHELIIFCSLSLDVTSATNKSNIVSLLLRDRKHDKGLLQ